MDLTNLIKDKIIDEMVGEITFTNAEKLAVQKTVKKAVMDAVKADMGDLVREAVNDSGVWDALLEKLITLVEDKLRIDITIGGTD